METKTWCAHNATRGCTLSSKVAVADSAREPLKVLKILVEGLARDSESSLWLTPLLHAPQLTRLFPFDFVYLDRDQRVIEGAALLPGVPLPQFTDQTASALILALGTLAKTKTQPGDKLVVCAEEELASRLAEDSTVPALTATDVAPATPVAESPIAAASLPFTTAPKLPVHPFPGPQVSAPTYSASATQGTGSTAAFITSWQISNSTAASAVLEPVDAQEEEAAREKLAVPTVESILEELAIEPERSVVADPAVVEKKLDVAGVSDETAAGVSVSDAASSAPVSTDVAAETMPAVELAKAEADAPKIETADLKPERKEIAEDLLANPAPPLVAPVDADPEPLKRKSREKKKESLGVLVKRFLNCEDPLPERRSIIRLLSKELAAYTANGEKTQQHEVRDVSPTGLYLRTKERWKPGEVVSLILQRKDAREKDHERRVHVQVRTVRCDEGGVGFSWLLPDGVEFQPWKRVHTKRSDESDADYFLRELRLTMALGFLRKICPSAADEMKLALHQRLSNKRVATAVEIVLKAQELIGHRERDAHVQAQPDMVRRILENGSWTEDEWIRQRWAGLLVSSCTGDGLDTSNSVFIDILAKLMPAHLRMLSFVCGKAAELIAAGKQPAAAPEVYCTAEELIEAVGSPSLARIQQTMGQLSSLGLLAESTRPSYIGATEKTKTKTTPTALGLQMYTRCNGRR